MSENGDTTATGVLKRTAPVWYWLREQFSLTSVLAIAGIVVTAGGIIINLNTRVVVLERVIKVVPDSSQLVELRTKVEGHEERIHRLEDDWDYASHVLEQSDQLNNRPPRGRRK